MQRILGVHVYVSTFFQTFPQIRLLDETERDQELTELIETTRKGWPNDKKLIHKVKVYYQSKSELSLVDDVIYKGQNIVIPNSLRKEMLNRPHDNHMSITKCLLLSESKVFWHPMRNELKHFIANCAVC